MQDFHYTLKIGTLVVETRTSSINKWLNFIKIFDEM